MYSNHCVDYVNNNNNYRYGIRGYFHAGPMGHVIKVSIVTKGLIVLLLLLARGRTNMIISTRVVTLSKLRPSLLSSLNK